MVHAALARPLTSCDAGAQRAQEQDHSCQELLRTLTAIMEALQGPGSQA